MSKYHILFNPNAGNGKAKEETLKLKEILADDELEFYDMTEIKDYGSFFAKIDPEDNLLISGGDGTLNRFVNDTDKIDIKNSIFYFATGSGNDFLHDINKNVGEVVEITRYLKDLPSVFVNGKEYKFLNAIGYGIDGYCCEVGDELRKTTNKPINYSGIAIKGLLFYYKPTNAVVTVDGATHTYKKVWLAPTMNGRFYGGGMMNAPMQDRLNQERKLSLVVMHGSGKIKTLMVFPSIFKGEHIKHTEMVTVIEGKDISVKFDRPVAIQIDGETVLGITEYRVKSNIIAKVK